MTGLIPAEEGHRLAREAVERALALNPNLAAAHSQIGRLKQEADFDWAGADASFHGRLLSSREIPKVKEWRLGRQPCLAALMKRFNWAAEPLTGVERLGDRFALLNVRDLVVFKADRLLKESAWFRTGLA